MKRSLGLIDKLLYGANLLTAILLILSFITPYIPPQKFPLLSALSLLVSPLLFLNLVFVIYWVIRLKKRVWLSALMLIIAYFHFNAFWKLGGNMNDLSSSHQLKILSFNVQLFEAYQDDPDPEIANKLKELIATHKPDVFVIQEFYKTELTVFDQFAYRYIHFRDDHRLGHAIFSKYPLINKGAFDFKSTTNNTIFTDVVVAQDTLRLYNLHLQSFKISPSVAGLQDRPGSLIRSRISAAFKLQQQQVSAIENDIGNSTHPIVLAGDMNNTAFSYIYRKFATKFQDAYARAGSGLGSTFTFDFYPIRIDYIFADPSLKVLDFETLKRPFADHHPVLSTLGWD